MIDYLYDLIQMSPNQLISYADYIDAVLYHPELGYYMKNKQKIGRQGDFITTSNISDIYGRIVAKWFNSICQKEGLSPVFCELGAGNGRFARAFLDEWHNLGFGPINYLIVESSPYHRQLQTELLAADFSIVQAVSLEELESFDGMVFSNELFDALPVHVIEMENGILYEVMVGIEKNKLIEKKIPLTDKAILAFLKESKIVLKDKQRIEVPLAMEGILRGISRVLQKGVLVTADYGYTTEEWEHPSRMRGSLRGYYQHHMVENVLENPGDMDITTHIHFDWLIQKGEQLQLKEVGKLRQDEFLLKAGILKLLENHFDPNPFSEISKRNRAIRSLVMPSGISSYFHILLQEKGLNVDEANLFEP